MGNHLEYITTGRRNRKSAERADIDSTNPRLEAGPELLRRILLGAVTALVVARPLVPGEDPGRLLVGTGVADQGFTLLWLLVAAGWGVWRAWSGQGAWFGSLVEAGLLGLAAVAFGSAFQAAYRQPALLVAGQWATLLVAFCMVRQLVRSRADNRALLAALLATGISLAVYAVYQARQPAVTLPPIDPTLAEIFDLPPEPAPPPEAVTATFVQPAVFADFLALLFPPLFGAALVSWRAEQMSWRTGILVACCVLFAVSLFLAQGWWPILLLMLVGTYAIFFWARPLSGKWGWVVAGLAGLVLVDVLVIAVAGFERLQHALAERAATWQATWQLIQERPWLGVGPGNFERELPVKLATPAVASAADPHNFLIEVTATLGLAGLALLLATVVVFFWRVRAILPEAAGQEESDEGPRTPWEFYLGGVAGLSLGFVLRYAEVGGSDALVEALVALCRSLVWFGAFAILESVPWTGRSQTLALAGGVAALLLSLLFDGGIGCPSLAQPLWVTAALTVNALPETAEVWQGRHWIGRILPAPFLGVLCFVYLLFVFYPAAAAAADASSARRYYRIWRDRYEPKWRQELESASSAAKRIEAANRADGLLRELIFNRLVAAAETEPANAALLGELGYWTGKRWQLFAEIGKIPNEDRAVEMRELQRRFGDDAKEAIAQAIKLDPKGNEGYWVEYLWRNQIARVAGGQEQRQQYLLAQLKLAQLIEHDPNDARLHFLNAQALFLVGDPEKARAEAQKAVELDEQAGPGRRRLSPPQLKQAYDWLAEKALR